MTCDLVVWCGAGYVHDRCATNAALLHVPMVLQHASGQPQLRGDDRATARCRVRVPGLLIVQAQWPSDVRCLGSVPRTTATSRWCRSARHVARGTRRRTPTAD